MRHKVRRLKLLLFICYNTSVRKTNTKLCFTYRGLSGHTHHSAAAARISGVVCVRSTQVNPTAPRITSRAVPLPSESFYCPPVGEPSIAISLSVCPRSYLWYRWTDLHKFFVQIPCGRGSDFLWRRCDMLCISGFVDDVT